MSRIDIVDTIVEKDGRVLMHRRKFHPEGKLDFPGGYVDEGESIEHAAIRETKEETGLKIKLVKKLGDYNYFDRGEKTTHVYIAEIIGGEESSSEEGEILWVPLKEIKEKDLAFPQAHLLVIKDLKTIWQEKF